jgi:hypothetical protein
MTIGAVIAETTAATRRDDDMASLRTDKRSSNRGPVVEMLTTPLLLTLFERTFAPLEPAAKRRIAEAARERGWDRTWDTDRLAA